MSEIFSNMPAVNNLYTQAKNIVDEPSAKITVKSAIPASNPIENKNDNKDSVEITTQKKEKKGPIKTIKGFIANIKKFFSTTSEYIKGTFKGITSGAVAGSLVYTGGAIVNSYKTKAAQKAGKELTKKIPNKILAGVVAAIALAANIWTASLNATEKQSEIDHRWTGHKN